MVLTNFKIIFDNDVGVYYCGQEIRGTVCFDLEVQIIMRCLNVVMKGKAEVEWIRSYEVELTSTDEESGERKYGTVQQLCKDQQEYFKDEHTILGGEESRYLPAGQYKYNFCYMLPNDIPCSFEGIFGHIRYTVEAIIVGSQLQNNTVEAPFSVIRPLDLNVNPRHREPVEDEANKTFGFLCCTSGPVSVHASVPVGGVVPGEMLLPTIRITNSSRAELSVKLEFIELVEYYANGFSAPEELIVAKKFLGRVAARDSFTWTNAESFIIPPLPPSTFQFCKLINVKYFLRIKCKRSTGFKLIDINLPIVVGTIPLVQNFQNVASTSSQNIETFPIGWNAVPQSPESKDSSSYANLPPPTYQEALVKSGLRNTEVEMASRDIQSKISFTPRYPVYTAARQ